VCVSCKAVTRDVWSLVSAKSYLELERSKTGVSVLFVEGATRFFASVVFLRKNYFCWFG